MEKNKKWLVAQAQIKTSRYGGSIADITLISSDGDIAHTYIDEQNRNYANWRDVLASIRQGNAVFINNVRYKRRQGEIMTKSMLNEPLVDADSKPKIIYTDSDADTVIDEFYQILK